MTQLPVAVLFWVCEPLYYWILLRISNSSYRMPNGSYWISNGRYRISNGSYRISNGSYRIYFRSFDKQYTVSPCISVHSDLCILDVIEISRILAHFTLSEFFYEYAEPLYYWILFIEYQMAAIEVLLWICRAVALLDTMYRISNGSYRILKPKTQPHYLGLHVHTHATISWLTHEGHIEKVN